MHGAKIRNPERTLRKGWKYPYYHHDYCTTLGHTSSVSNECGMKRKSKDEMKAIRNAIEKEVLERIISNKEGTYNLIGTK